MIRTHEILSNHAYISSTFISHLVCRFIFGLVCGFSLFLHGSYIFDEVTPHFGKHVVLY